MKLKKILAILLSVSLISNHCQQKVKAIKPAEALSVATCVIMLGGAGVMIVGSAIDWAVLKAEVMIRGGFRDRREATRCVLDIVEGKSPIRIYGQERAKLRCREVLTSYFETIYRMPGASEQSFVRNARGNVIYIIGRPGVGKSTMARAIANAFLRHSECTCFILNSSDINPEQPLGEQLFKFATRVTNIRDVRDERGARNLWGLLGDQRYCAEARVAAPMLAHLIKWNGEAVVIIDEYDKMKIECAAGDAPDGEDHSADEIIKSIADTGSYRVGADVIDCTKTLFLITTNESREQLERSFGYRGAVGGGVQRLNIIEFDDLSEDCCRRIVDDMVSFVRQTLTDPCGDYKIQDVTFSEETLSAMAEYIMRNEVRQGRAVTDLEHKIYALFCYELEENAGGSFEVQYTPSGEAGKIGEFSKVITGKPARRMRRM